MKTEIYYFSGTGNTLKLARDLAKKLDQCELIPIVKNWKKKSINSDADCIGLFFPLYYLRLPIIVEEFIKKIKLYPSTYIFVVITYYRSFKGYAIHQIKRLYRNNNLILKAGFYIRMPTNFIAHYKVPLLKEQQKLFTNASIKIDEIYENIINRSLKYDKEPYYLIFPFISSILKFKFRDVRYFWADSKCNGCGICKRICLNNNISIVDKKPHWDNRCIDCFSCIHFCFQKAIQYKKKTIYKERYHHPDISYKDILNQKEQSTSR